MNRIPENAAFSVITPPMMLARDPNRFFPKLGNMLLVLNCLEELPLDCGIYSIGLR